MSRRRDTAQGRSGCSSRYLLRLYKARMSRGIWKYSNVIIFVLSFCFRCVGLSEQRECGSQPVLGTSDGAWKSNKSINKLTWPLWLWICHHSSWSRVRTGASAMWHSPPRSHRSGLKDRGNDGEGQTSHQDQWGGRSPAKSLGGGRREAITSKDVPTKGWESPAK